MEDRCKLCSQRREEGSEYCPYHGRAYAKLSDAFGRWRRALSIEWDEFLRKVSENPETGEWAREVVEDLLRRGLP